MSEPTLVEPPLKRAHVAALDEILGVRLPVLDDGFVRLVDYMGGDESIVQAARVSYGAGTKRLSEDRGLLRYLMRHHHSTPFEMCEIKLHVRVPMDCWRQWIRHRTASVNEYSTRYSLAIDSAQSTDATEWRRQTTVNRQGSDDLLDAEVGSRLSQREHQLAVLAREVYEERIAAEVAREQARKDLPLSTYTEAYWKIDLHNLFGFLRLRMDRRAQAEIRQFATTIGHQIVAKWCPIAWDAFLDYQVDSVQLSGIERRVISLLSAGKGDDAIAELTAIGLLATTSAGVSRNRERLELEEKLRDLSIAIPWLE